MKRHLITSILMTVVTTILFGLMFPLLITGLAQLIFPRQANGQLLHKDGVIIGSQIIGQPFSSPGYFHSRPSAAGNGYDAGSSSGSNLGPTNHVLIDRVASATEALQKENPSMPVPIDLVTTSASGLDPDISPAAAQFQIPRIARARGLKEEDVHRLINDHTQGRQLGFLGEPRVNVMGLNLALDGIPSTPPTNPNAK